MTCDEAGCGRRDERAEHGVDACDLGVERLDAAGELTQRELRGSVDRGRIRGPEPGGGRLDFSVDDEQFDLGPGSRLHMAPGTNHALIAVEPTVMLLTLIAE